MVWQSTCPYGMCFSGGCKYVDGFNEVFSKGDDPRGAELVRCVDGCIRADSGTGAAHKSATRYGGPTVNPAAHDTGAAEKPDTGYTGPAGNTAAHGAGAAKESHTGDAGPAAYAATGRT
jgi:hypothetical protein